MNIDTCVFLNSSRQFQFHFSSHRDLDKERSFNDDSEFSVNLDSKHMLISQEHCTWSLIRTVSPKGSYIGASQLCCLTESFYKLSHNYHQNYNFSRYMDVLSCFSSIYFQRETIF